MKNSMLCLRKRYTLRALDIGITGHRDICKKNRDDLADKVKEILLALRKDGMADVPIAREQVQDPVEKNEPGLGLGRDPERTPMPWDGTPRAGFSSGVPWLPLGADHASVNVVGEDRSHDPCVSAERSRRNLMSRR